MVRLISKRVTVEAPPPFTDEDAESLIETIELTLERAIEAAVSGTIDAAKSRKVPLADVATFVIADD